MTTVETVFFVLGVWLTALVVFFIAWFLIEESIHYLRRRSL